MSFRNDAATPGEAMAMRPDAVVISPGPCDPDRAGITLDLIEEAATVCPLLGVCLGHQAIGQPSAARWCARRRPCTARPASSTTTDRGFPGSAEPVPRRALP
jgi:anthranilate synthase component 2